MEKFWETSKYYTENYVEESLTDEMITFSEKELGYKFPKTYIELMKIQNGGKPIKKYWIKGNPKRNEVSEIGITGFLGIGSTKKNSLFGQYGNEFWFKEWGYPRDIGVIIADTESGGHEMIYLDYRECGEGEEPKVSVCFQEYDYEIQVLANSFKEFLSMLVSAEEFEEILLKD